MKCRFCRAELKASAKSCGHCGAKVSKAKGESQRPMFVANPLGLEACAIKVIECEYEATDCDRGIWIDVKYKVSNKTDRDWEYLKVDTQLFSDKHVMLTCSSDTQEEKVPAGESAAFEIAMSMRARDFANQPEKTYVMVEVTACDVAFKKLGDFDIPERPHEKVSLDPVRLGDVLQLVGGTLLKTEPDDENESTIEVKALVQNLTPRHLYEVKIEAEVRDKCGRLARDASGHQAVIAGDICMISGDGSAKDKEFKGATATVALRAYFPVATGIGRRAGLSIRASEDVDGEDE